MNIFFRLGVTLLVAAFLAACASGPRSGSAQDAYSKCMGQQTRPVNAGAAAWCSRYLGPQPRAAEGAE